MDKTVSYYDNLQVCPQASASVIRAAFKALSQKWHPDKHLGVNEVTRQKYEDIKQAYDVLSDPASRKDYDLWLKNIETHTSISNNNAKQLFKYYSFKEKKSRISVIV